MKFLVTRMDALHDHSKGGSRHKINNSEMWPTVVEARSSGEAVREVYKLNFGPYQGLPSHREFLVVPLNAADVVCYKPLREYTIESHPYNSNTC